MIENSVQFISPIDVLAMNRQVILRKLESKKLWKLYF